MVRFYNHPHTKDRKVMFLVCLSIHQMGGGGNPWSLVVSPFWGT